MYGALLVDFGSTFTKLALVDLDTERLVATAQSPSTVGDDMMRGFYRGLDILLSSPRAIELGVRDSMIEIKRASSSAAGGLRLVAVGLVPQLTLEAARMAAMGAGAKVVGSYSHELTVMDVRSIEQHSCDIILLSGGTDGGNRDVVTHNARMLAQSPVDVPIVVAANRVASPGAVEILRAAGKEVEATENVLPELDRINVEPARHAIRSQFIRRIVKAKGLDRAQEYLGGVVMPTPMATLKAAELLANGTDDEPGIGELMVVEVGGATTNIHSVAHGHPTGSHTMAKGLPEPYAKRTVEGDLGIRYNAPTIVELAGAKRVLDNLPTCCGDLDRADLQTAVNHLAQNVGSLPRSEVDYCLDVALAKTAVTLASARHAGTLREIALPTGIVLLQLGKDLTTVGSIIGAGGVFVHGRGQDEILKQACFTAAEPQSLRPKSPAMYVDSHYVLYAAGLLSEVAPTKALRIAKQSLRRVA